MYHATHALETTTLTVTSTICNCTTGPTIVSTVPPCVDDNLTGRSTQITTLDSASVLSMRETLSSINLQNSSIVYSDSDSRTNSTAETANWMADSSQLSQEAATGDLLAPKLLSSIWYHNVSGGITGQANETLTKEVFGLAMASDVSPQRISNATCKSCEASNPGNAFPGVLPSVNDSLWAHSAPLLQRPIVSNGNDTGVHIPSKFNSNTIQVIIESWNGTEVRRPGEIAPTMFSTRLGDLTSSRLSTESWNKTVQAIEPSTQSGAAILHTSVTIGASDASEASKGISFSLIIGIGLLALGCCL